MKTVKVTLLCEDGEARVLQFTENLLFELAKSLDNKEKEQVHTTHGSYWVSGLLIGQPKTRIIVLDQKEDTQ